MPEWSPSFSMRIFQMFLELVQRITLPVTCSPIRAHVFLQKYRIGYRLIFIRFFRVNLLHYVLFYYLNLIVGPYWKYNADIFAISRLSFMGHNIAHFHIIVAFTMKPFGCHLKKPFDINSISHLLCIESVNENTLRIINSCRMNISFHVNIILPVIYDIAARIVNR